MRKIAVRSSRGNLRSTLLRRMPASQPIVPAESGQRDQKKSNASLYQKAKNAVYRVRQIKISNFQLSRSLLLFVPGALFVCMSVAAVFQPRLLLPLAALLLLFCGVALTFGAWKVLQLKGKVQGILKHVEGRLVIQGVSPQELFDESQGPESSKKIVLH